MGSINYGIDIGLHRPAGSLAYEDERLGRMRPLEMATRATIGSVIAGAGSVSGARTAPGADKYLAHVLDLPLSFQSYKDLSAVARCIGVTRNFREVIDYFKVPENETPAGFKLEFAVKSDGLV